MKPTAEGINEFLLNRSGISNTEEIIGFYHVGTNPVFEILEVRKSLGNGTKYYVRTGDETDFKRCNFELEAYCEMYSTFIRTARDALNGSLNAPKTLDGILRVKQLAELKIK